MAEKEQVTHWSGYKNYETWNVIVWLNNEEWIYKSAVQFMGRYKGRSPYKDFVDKARTRLTKKTADGVRWDDENLDYQTLNREMYELKKDYVAPSWKWSKNQRQIDIVSDRNA